MIILLVIHGDIHGDEVLIILYHGRIMRIMVMLMR